MKRVLAAAIGLLAMSDIAQAQEFYIAQIITLATNFCPRGSVNAAGQLLPISDYAALYSLIGATYGGDGVTTFALPNLKPVFTQNRTILTQCIVINGIFPVRN